MREGWDSYFLGIARILFPENVYHYDRRKIRVFVPHGSILGYVADDF
mgnify:FL=1